MRYPKTEKCVICGEKAICWHGHVLGKEKMALGNYVTKKVVAGFCEIHKDAESETACYGEYDNEKMGKCIPMVFR